jgi:hypothetical protein
MDTSHTGQSVLKHRYAAKGSDGKAYEVHVYFETASAESIEQGAPMEKISSVRTADGAELRVIRKGHYEIVDSGVTLTSTAPEAI